MQTTLDSVNTAEIGVESLCVLAEAAELTDGFCSEESIYTALSLIDDNQLLDAKRIFHAVNNPQKPSVSMRIKDVVAHGDVLSDHSQAREAKLGSFIFLSLLSQQTTDMTPHIQDRNGNWARKNRIEAISRASEEIVAKYMFASGDISYLNDHQPIDHESALLLVMSGLDAKKQMPPADVIDVRDEIAYKSEQDKPQQRETLETGNAIQETRLSQKTLTKITRALVETGIKVDDQITPSSWVLDVDGQEYAVVDVHQMNKVLGRINDDAKTMFTPEVIEGDIRHLLINLNDSHMPKSIKRQSGGKRIFYSSNNSNNDRIKRTFIQRTPLKDTEGRQVVLHLATARTKANEERFFRQLGIQTSLA